MTFQSTQPSEPNQSLPALGELVKTFSTGLGGATPCGSRTRPTHVDQQRAIQDVPKVRIRGCSEPDKALGDDAPQAGDPCSPQMGGLMTFPEMGLRLRESGRCDGRIRLPWRRVTENEPGAPRRALLAGKRHRLVSLRSHLVADRAEVETGNHSVEIGRYD